MKQVKFEHLENGEWKLFDTAIENNLPSGLEEYINYYNSFCVKNGLSDRWRAVIGEIL